jgi:hypothetical protein
VVESTQGTERFGVHARAMTEELRRQLARDPCPLLGLAFGAGYVLGGGLFSAFSRPLARAAVGRLVWPLARDRMARAAGTLRKALFTQPAAEA